MIRADLLDLPRIEHAFFTRRGGVSTGIYASLNCGPGSGDDPALVAENRELASELLGTMPAHLCTLHQVHGRGVVFVTKPWTHEMRPRADAMVTAVPGLTLGILTADCVPVLFADPISHVVGAAHAGWKGTLGGVLEATVEAMTKLGARPRAIRAAIGPAIGHKSYEVGAEFRDRFVAADARNARFFVPGQRRDHFLFDIVSCVEARLRATGVEEIERLNRDTYDEEDYFFSFRRSTHHKEPDYGRQLSAIALVGPGPT